jgi:NADPH-dependent 2,4-dienoyl-CoA reductase/sulfur reductase-like enzyme
MVDRLGARVVIVGAGQAGARCAEALRALGHAGPITLLGDEPQWPYERPPLSKSFLAGTSALDAARVLVPGWYAEHEVGLRLNDRVSAIDSHRRHISLASGDTLPYGVVVPFVQIGALSPGTQYPCGFPADVSVSADRRH